MVKLISFKHRYLFIQDKGKAAFIAVVGFKRARNLERCLS